MGNKLFNEFGNVYVSNPKIEKSTINNVELEKYKYVIMSTLSDNFFNVDSINFQKHADFIANSIIIQARCHIYGSVLTENHYKYPSNWKEALKERFFPKWLLLKFPVKYTNQTLELLELYPKLSNKIEKGIPNIRMKEK